MELSDIGKILKSFEHNACPKEYKNRDEAIDYLKQYILENWNESHGEIIKMLSELNSKEKFIDYEIFLFDCLRFPCTRPLMRYKDGSIQEEEIHQFPFNKYCYHDSRINRFVISDHNLILNVDLIEEWKNDEGNGWNQTGNTYNMCFNEFSMNKKTDNDNFQLMSDAEILERTALPVLHQMYYNKNTEFVLPNRIYWRQCFDISIFQLDFATKNYLRK